MKSELESQERPSTFDPDVKNNPRVKPLENLSCKIAALSDLSPQQLRDEWRRLYRGQPPRLSRGLLIRTLAYRTQELLHGGLSKATERQLAAVTKELAVGSDSVLSTQPRLRPGARLARDWRGRTHTVVVTEDGFDYAGETYSSLTKIAHRITALPSELVMLAAASRSGRVRATNRSHLRNQQVASTLPKPYRTSHEPLMGIQGKTDGTINLKGQIGKWIAPRSE